MSNELVDNGCMTTPEIKEKQELRRQRNKMSNELSNNGEFKQDYEWEDVIPEQDKQTEEPWYPEIVGETLTGTYLYKKESMGKYNQTIYIIEDETGKLQSVFDCKVLHNLFEYIDEGDFIKITFEGRKTTGNGNEFKDFKVQRRTTY